MHRIALSCVALGGLTASSALAHVRVNSPNGGEVLDVGSIFTIEWEIVIRHDTQDWDVFYSTDSNTGDWIPIAMDLPAGDTNVGSIHTFDWIVPDDIAPDAWVYVIQDNSGRDYDDVSDGSFSIVPAPGSVAMLGVFGVLASGRRRTR